MNLRDNPLLFYCAKTVSGGHLFEPRSLLIERKQIPQVVVTKRSSRKPIAPLETIHLPWAQGVGRSNRPDPTKPPADSKALRCIGRPALHRSHRFFASTQPKPCQRPVHPGPQATGFMMGGGVFMETSDRAFDSPLPRPAFEKLLRCFHSDRAEADKAYLRLRDKLVSYFEFSRCRPAEDLADEVLTRVGRRNAPETDPPGTQAAGILPRLPWHAGQRKRACAPLPRWLPGQASAGNQRAAARLLLRRSPRSHRSAQATCLRPRHSARGASQSPAASARRSGNLPAPLSSQLSL